MDMKKKLVELLRYVGDNIMDFKTEDFMGNLASYLIANGVTVTDTNVGKWIPVTERLPEIVKTTRAGMNVYRTSDRVLCACLQKSGKQMVKEGVMELFNDSPKPYWRIPGSINSVTHWMPLPKPPKGE